MQQKVTWIVENQAKEASFKELQEAVVKSGSKYLFINGDFDSQTLSGINSECVVFSGGIEMAKIVKTKLEAKSCYPILYCNFPNYLCSKYYSYFGEYLFNDHYAIISLKELKRKVFYYWGQFGKEALIFIRPDSGEKLFQAQLLDIIDFDKFYETNKHLEHELVVISTPKTIIGEWRVICSKDSIIDYSLYRYQGQISKIRVAPTNVLEFATKMLKVGYLPDNVFCFDICTDSDNNCWLLELTSFSSCGLYASDKNKLVKEISKIALKDYASNY